MHAEHRDAEVLHRPRHVVDDHAADGEQRGGQRTGHDRDDLGHSERHGCGRHTGQPGAYGKIHTTIVHPPEPNGLTPRLRIGPQRRQSLDQCVQ